MKPERPKNAREQLEPAAAPLVGLQEAAIVSIAISLRRLADVIEFDAQQQGWRRWAAAQPIPVPKE